MQQDWPYPVWWCLCGCPFHGRWNWCLLVPAAWWPWGAGDGVLGRDLANRLSSHLLSCTATSLLNPSDALPSTPAAPDRNLTLWSTCYGTSCTSWSTQHEKIRWKECGHELLPCECLLLHSALASFPSFCLGLAHLEVRSGCAGSPRHWCHWHMGMLTYGGTGSTLTTLLLLALKLHLSPKQDLDSTCFPVTCKYLGTCLSDSVLEQIFINAQSCSPGRQWKPSVPFGTCISQLRSQWQLSTQVSSDCIVVGLG